MADPSDTQRVRELFDKQLARSIDQLFAMPDVVEAIYAVAEGSAAIVISGGTLQILTVVPHEAALVPDHLPDAWPGMTL